MPPRTRPASPSTRRWWWPHARGGADLQALTDGLPQSHAYGIAYRHAVDVDRSGTWLAFGSTTGSLWVSQDGGDRWTCLSEHLPPVYAVRFG